MTQNQPLRRRRGMTEQAGGRGPGGVPHRTVRPRVGADLHSCSQQTEQHVLQASHSPDGHLKAGRIKPSPRGSARLTEPYVYTYPAKKSLQAVMSKVKSLCRQIGVHQTLDDLLRKLNPAIRGCCA